MRAVIVGAGAIGAGLGALLHLGGLPVQFVARGEQLEALRRGLRLRRPRGIEHLPLPACSLDELSPQPRDVLLIATKLPDTPALLPQLEAWSHAPVVSLQGGLIGDRWLAERWERVLGSVVYVPANVLRPGEVTLWGAPTPGRVILGEAQGRAKGVSASLAKAWRAGGLSAGLHRDITAAKRRKLWVNLGGLPWALTGELGGPATEAAQAEALAVFAAAGLPVAPLEDILEPGLGLAEIEGESRPGPSLADSLRRGRRSEGHYTYGEIVRLGRELGVPTPVNARLLALLEQAEAAGALPTGWTQAGLSG